MRHRYVALLGLLALLFAAPVMAAVSRSTIAGAPGDLITEGLDFTTDSGPYDWSLNHIGGSDEIIITAYLEDGRSLAFRFIPPNDSTMRLGRTDVVGYFDHFFDPPHGGMMVRFSPDGGPLRSCPNDQMVGWFEVKDFYRNEFGAIESFWIDYSATCHLASESFHGTVIYKSSHPTSARPATWGTLKTIYR